MAVDHKAIPDAELHPPKGFAGAANNTVLTRTSGAPTWKALTAENLASNSVTTAKIADGNVNADKLATDSVTTAKVLNRNITAQKLAEDVAEATWVGGRSAAMPLYGLGTYIMASYEAAGLDLAVNPGDKVSGSNLKPSNADGGSAGTAGFINLGTWECMGYARTVSNSARVTLWRRVVG